MQYKISCLYMGDQLCEQVIDAPHHGAAETHYESLIVRQPEHPQFRYYMDWKLERLSVEDALVLEGETETEKKARQIREKLARGESLL